MTEQQADYVTDALEMMGTGYDHPAIEIEQERTVIQRRNGKLESVDKPAFVKLSTAFKQELPEISGDALKVWIFISLSINRKTETANPGLRTIAEGVGLAVNTVQKCLVELEGLELLTVDRKSRKYNIYEAPEYVSANRSDPVSQFDTDGETVSNPTETVSNSAQTVSHSVILNQSNQKEPDISETLKKRKQSLAGTSIEAAIWAGTEISEEMTRALKLRTDAQNEFERALGFSKPLPWTVDKDWQMFGGWVMEKYHDDPQVFQRYETWRNQPYVRGAIDNKRLRGFVTEFYDSFDMFLKQDKPENKDNRTSMLRTL